MKDLHVLLVEDVTDDADLVLHELRRGGFEPAAVIVTNEAEFREALQQHRFDLVISDYSLPSFNAPRCLAIYHELDLDIPFILTSGTVGEEVAVDAMKLGAHDYVMKERLQRLVPAVQRELKEAKVRREHRRTSEHVRFLAYFDPVTRLPNQRLFADELEAALVKAQREHIQFAVVCLDINDYSDLRNVLGQTLGDSLVRKVAERLKSQLTTSLGLGRIAEGTFGLLLPLPADAAHEAVTRHLLGLFEESLELEISPLHVDVTVGVALYPSQGTAAPDLLQKARIAVRQAHLHSTPVALYLREDDRSNPDRLALLGEMREAIRRGQLFLDYQPILDLKSMRLSSVEALVRWQHPKRGITPPEDFLEQAEHSGLIRPLTEAVVVMAFAQSGAWQKTGIRLPVSINLSARNLQDVGLVDTIALQADEYKVLPRDFIFEITESALMTNFAAARATLNRLRDMGFRIAIDDFGTGHSSLAYLTQLPVQLLKLDRSFVARITTDNNSLAIFSILVELAKQLRMTVIAEGVETEEMLTAVRGLGSDCAQGYHIGRPQSAQQLRDWINEQLPQLAVRYGPRRAVSA